MSDLALPADYPHAQIPWFHNRILPDKVKDPAEREWYVRQTIENGWSRNVLAAQVERSPYHRPGRAVSNFARTRARPTTEEPETALSSLST